MEDSYIVQNTKTGFLDMIPVLNKLQGIEVRIYNFFRPGSQKLQEAERLGVQMWRDAGGPPIVTEGPLYVAPPSQKQRFAHGALALGIVKYLDPDNTVVLNEVMEAVKTRCFHFSAPSRKRSAEPYDDDRPLKLPAITPATICQLYREDEERAMERDSRWVAAYQNTQSNKLERAQKEQREQLLQLHKEQRVQQLQLHNGQGDQQLQLHKEQGDQQLQLHKEHISQLQESQREGDGRYFAWRNEGSKENAAARVRFHSNLLSVCGQQQQPQEDEEGEEEELELSEAGGEALLQVNDAEDKLKGLQHRFKSLDSARDRDLTSEDGGAVKDQLAQLGGDLDKLQYETLDAICTVGLDEQEADFIKARRKSVHAKVDELRGKISETHMSLQGGMDTTG